MQVRNYYLVNKDTKEIHYLLKVDPSFMSHDDGPESWLSGDLYMADEDKRMTLDALRSINYSDEHELTGYFETEQSFMFISNINYVTYKGYRIYHSPETLQLWDDFTGNNWMEANAFLTTCFKQFIGDDEVSKWNQVFENSFQDKYGINEIIMNYFTIEQDDDINVQNHPDLR